MKASIERHTDAHERLGRPHAKAGRRTLLLALLPASTAVWAQDTALDALMRRFAAIPRSRASFTEEKALPELDLPLPSEGMLTWQAPDRLEKHTTTPIEEVLRVEGSHLAYERPDRGIRRDFSLDEHPEMRALVEAIRGTLAGDLGVLRRNYEISFDGTADGAWRLALTPQSFRVRAAVQRIYLSGRGPQVLMVATEGNGGVTRMRITPLP
jgi:outer membrane lipoprotein-sorting protein